MSNRLNANASCRIVIALWMLGILLTCGRVVDGQTSYCTDLPLYPWYEEPDFFDVGTDSDYYVRCLDPISFPPIKICLSDTCLLEFGEWHDNPVCDRSFEEPSGMECFSSIQWKPVTAFQGICANPNPENPQPTNCRCEVEQDIVEGLSKQVDWPDMRPCPGG